MEVIAMSRNDLLPFAASCLFVLSAFSCGSDASGNGGASDAEVAAADGRGLDTEIGATEVKPQDTADSGSTEKDTQAPCNDGERSCLGDSRVALCVNGKFEFNADCGDAAVCKDGYCTKPADCEPGQPVSCEGPVSEWVCNPEGTALTLHVCDVGKMCIDGQCGNAICTPGTGQCTSSSIVRKCLPDGSGYSEPEPCEIGKTCVGGMCLSLCENDIKQNTNVGCQYWAVDLDNDTTHNPALPFQPTPEMFPHSVVISNPGSSDVAMSFSVMVSCADGTQCSPSVTTCNGKEATVCDKPAAEYDLDVGDSIVPAGTSKEFTMPVMNVHGSSLAPKAIRVVASLPVVAYQFNPFNSENATSNDGSLLLPQNALGLLYYAVSLPSRGALMMFPENNGFLAVIATQPDTTVGITPTVNVIANPAEGIPPDGTTPEFLPPGKTYVFTLQPYQVLNLEQLAEGGIITPGTIPKDLTGTRVEADKPIAVFSGHQVAGIQEALKLQITDVWDSCCTEHMEEQLMPVETWGTEALCVKSKPRGYEADRFVVLGAEPGIQLTTIPPLDGFDGKTLEKPGVPLRVETTESFMLKATGKIQVVQFLMSQGQTQPIGSEPGTGDPSMMIIPPSNQYRDEYVIQTGEGYGSNWLTVIRPQGIPVQLDGVAVPDGEFDALGDGTWEFAYHQVQTGTHSLVADQPFGIMVYGYGSVTAYGYPGGMSLKQE